MKISVETEGKRFSIRIPTWALVNAVTANAIAGRVNKKSGREEAVLPPAVARALAKELRACKKRFPEWTLVEVETEKERVEVRV